MTKRGWRTWLLYQTNTRALSNSRQAIRRWTSWDCPFPMAPGNFQSVSTVRGHFPVIALDSLNRTYSYFSPKLWSTEHEQFLNFLTDRQVTLFEEFMLLKEFEKRENIFANKVNTKLSEKDEMREKVSARSGQIPRTDSAVRSVTCATRTSRPRHVWLELAASHVMCYII